MKEKDLTQEQINYIKEHYPKEQTWKIANDLDVPTYVVSKWASHNNLRKDKDFFIVRQKGKITPHQAEFICNNYSTMKNKDIMKELGISYDELRSFSSRRGLNKENKLAYSNCPVTKEQQEYIFKNYSNMETRDMVEFLNMKEVDIARYANFNGLVKSKDLKKRNKSKLTFEQKRFIEDNYSTMKTSEIVKKLNITYDAIKGYSNNLKLKKNSQSSLSYNHYLEELLEKRNSGNYILDKHINKNIEPKVDDSLLYKSKYGKYSVNQDYFKVINNEWKAYWLGFLYADGCNRINKRGTKNEYILMTSLCVADFGHLEKLNNSLQSNNPIKEHDIKLNGNIYKSAKLTICNKEICLDLNVLGCTPRKSLTLEFPTEDKLPKHLIRHFIRGYFDGDGCIHINLEKRTVVANILGTYDMLYSINKILCEELKMEERLIKQKKDNKAYDFAINGLTNINNFYKYLYKDCNIYLERKLKKFDTLFCLD